MRAAMVCFAKHGFHQTSMHDISGQAGISVGLIYRYFENKEAVISAMADAHKAEIQALLERARLAPSLLEALELFFTAHCCSDERQIECAFVVDLFAEASRNPPMAQLVRDVLESVIGGVTELIAQSPEMREVRQEMEPRQLAELIFAAARGQLMRDAVDVPETSDAERRERQIELVRSLWRLLFKKESESIYA
ncbi:MAG TPA: helix-turn-helix domain-containing protein [Chthoniobacterales bacterium]